MFFHENQHFCVSLDNIVIFGRFFELKKMCNVIGRRMVHTRARELPYLTIWAILDNVGTKTTPAQAEACFEATQLMISSF